MDRQTACNAFEASDFPEYSLPGTSCQIVFKLLGRMANVLSVVRSVSGFRLRFVRCSGLERHWELQWKTNFTEQHFPSRINGRPTKARRLRDEV